MKETNRIFWIDALRGFAITLVIIGHIGSIPEWLFKWIFGFHMSLFFVISGYLFNVEKWKEKGFKQFFISKAKSYLVPFVILSIIIFIIEILKILIFSNVIYWQEFIKYMIDYLKWLLFQIDGDFCGGLNGGFWFLPCFFISALISFFILQKNKFIKISFILLSLFIVKITSLYVIKLPWHIDAALIGGSFMLCGNFIKKYNLLPKLNNVFLILFIFLLGNICIVFNSQVDFKAIKYGNPLLMFLGGLLMSFFLLWLFNKINIKTKMLNLFGSYSILIMALNYPLFRLLDKILSIFNINQFWVIYVILEILIFSVFLFLYKKLERKNKIFTLISGH